MQHSRQSNVAAPLRPAGNFFTNTGYRIGRSDDPELAHRFHRRVSGHGETVERCDTDPLGRVSFRGLPCNGNRQIEVLTLNKLPVADALSTARYRAIGDGKTGDGNTELRRSQSQ